jgi:hypothetical protein
LEGGDDVEEDVGARDERAQVGRADDGEMEEFGEDARFLKSQELRTMASSKTIFG